MKAVAKERIAIIVVSALLLWSWGPTLPHVTAAIVGVVFFCWFVGLGEPANAGGIGDAEA